MTASEIFNVARQLNGDQLNSYLDLLYVQWIEPTTALVVRKGGSPDEACLAWSFCYDS